MDRLEYIRMKTDCILNQMPIPEEQKFAYIHLYGVSKWAAFLAMKQNLDPQIAAVAGMLHDLARYQEKINHRHAERSAVLAEAILKSSQLFTDSEINMIRDAISRHSDKEHIHGDYDELLKNSDVLDHYFYNPHDPIAPADQKRLLSLLKQIL